MVSNSDKRKNLVYLSLGSNLGDKRANLRECLLQIQSTAGTILRESSIYESESWGNVSLPNFLNQVVLIATQLEPEELLKQLHSIEKQMGRSRKKTKNYLSRTIDIDILYYNDRIMKSINLCIPHPHLHERNFVLQPLSEIAADFVHPILGLKNYKILEMSKDKLNCTKTI